MATWNKILFPDAASPLMEQMILFHDHALILLLFITSLVLYTLTILISNQLTHTALINHHLLEIIWSSLPIVLLISLALPSLKLLYQMEEVRCPLVVIKGFGHQWYWSYEYSNYNNLELDSYMTEWDSQTPFRLLNTDHKITLPIHCETRFLISSQDVIHAWTLPSMGVKVDAVPGRINQVFLTPYRPGIFFGQCSEICGANHSFMPIVLQVSSLKYFLNWLNIS